jgi:hypothetical protein
LFKWLDSILRSKGYVNINGQNYDVEFPEFDAETPLTAENLNLMQTLIEQKIGLEEFDPTISYDVGHMIIKDNKLYRCVMEYISGPYADFDSCFIESSIEEELDDIHYKDKSTLRYKGDITSETQLNNTITPRLL